MGRKKSEYMEDKKEWSEHEPDYINLRVDITNIASLDKDNEFIPQGLEKDYSDASLYLSALIDEDIQVKNPAQYAATVDLLAEVVDRYEKDPSQFFQHHETRKDSYSSVDRETYYTYEYKETPLAKKLNIMDAKEAYIPLYQRMNDVKPILSESKNEQLAQKEQSLFDLYHSMDQYDLRKLSGMEFLKALAIRKTASDELNKLMESPEYVKEAHYLGYENIKEMASLKEQAKENKDKMIRPEDVKRFNALNRNLDKTYNDWKATYSSAKVFLYNNVMKIRNFPLASFLKDETKAIKKEYNKVSLAHPWSTLKMNLSSYERNVENRNSNKHWRIEAAIEEADKDLTFTQYARTMCDCDGKPLVGYDLNLAYQDIADRHRSMINSLDKFYEFDHRDGTEQMHYDNSLEISNKEFIGEQKNSSTPQQEEETCFERVVAQMEQDKRENGMIEERQTYTRG